MYSDVEDLHSAPLIELDDIPPTTVDSTALSWHPKLTPYRLCVVSLTISLGTAKAIATYRKESVAPITVEWFSGVVVFLALYLCGIYEYEINRETSWFFDLDCMNFIWRTLRRYSLQAPNYRTDERSVERLIKPPHPPVTGYRMLVTFTAICFGMVKSSLSYRGLSTAPTTIEWIFGVVVTLGLYWFGLYEVSSTEVLPSMFEVDCSRSLFEGGVAVIFMTSHILALIITIGWTYIIYSALVGLWSHGLISPKEPGPPSTEYERFFELAFTLMLSSICACAVMEGIAVSCGVLWCMGKTVAPLVAEAMEKLKAIIGFQDRDSGMDMHASLLSVVPEVQEVIIRGPSPALRLIYDGFKYSLSSPPELHVLTSLPVVFVLLILGYIIGHTLAFFITIGWTLLCVFGIIQTRKFFSEPSLATQGMFTMICIWVFGMLLPVPAISVATVIGAFGSLAVLWSFFSPLTGRVGLTKVLLFTQLEDMLELCVIMVYLPHANCSYT
ncbi:hypothetical protein BDQ12DRAFT_92571 [Crucibulum laeve]|uniref:Uncharacterized protein n=1 Tax=Crucibulum laeve TaxID=68775 RepID=A0A5C3LIL9_9AGAR|nr:hypothetical protein BDQ12DRAFT_92571 [Crucibulum laeve]